MRLFDAILEANRRRMAGDAHATIPPAEFAAALPVAALTCIDARLNHLLPDALGLPEEQFIWLRNAGNIITGPLSSTMRSLALACVIKGAKEIVIIGHTDCLVGRTTALQLLDRLSAFGIDRQRIPANLVEYFGLFGSERQNVLRGVEFVRGSPLIGPRIPIHGLILDVSSGRIDWMVNGYEAADAVAPGKVGGVLEKADRLLTTLTRIGDFSASELKLPETKIGEIVSVAGDWLHKAEHVAAAAIPAPEPAAPPAASGAPPPLRPSAPTAVTSPFSVLRRRKTNQPGR